MKGARMRWYSLSGTRPRKTSRSVPRLTAPTSARTRTPPAPGAATDPARISARPGPTYHSASASFTDGSGATVFRLDLDWRPPLYPVAPEKTPLSLRHHARHPQLSGT